MLLVSVRFVAIRVTIYYKYFISSNHCQILFQEFWINKKSSPNPSPIGNKHSMEFCIFSQFVCVSNTELAMR